MENRYRKEKYYFRIYNISREKMEIFKREFPGLNYKITQLRKRKDVRKKVQRFTIMIELNRQSHYGAYINQLISYIRKHKIPETSYGLWISLTENRDYGGLTVPDYVKDFYFKIYNKIGGQIDFSCIFIDV